MDPIQTLLQRHHDQINNFNTVFLALPNCLKISEDTPRRIEKFSKIVEKVEQLHEKYNIELLVCQAKNKTTSSKLLNIHAQIQVQTLQADHIIEELTNILAEYTEQKRIEDERLQREYQERVKQAELDERRKKRIAEGTYCPDFVQFRQERVREGASYPDLNGEEVLLKEIAKCYNKWALYKNKSRKDLKQLEKLCDEAFGDSRGTKKYKHLRVFLDEEDLENFEENYKEVLEME